MTLNSHSRVCPSVTLRLNHFRWPREHRAQSKGGEVPGATMAQTTLRCCVSSQSLHFKWDSDTKMERGHQAVSCVTGGVVQGF